MTKIYYKGVVDENPVEVTIIQESKDGTVEIVRNNRVNGRESFAGFWVNKDELIFKLW